MLANKKDFDLLGDNIVELSTENDFLKNETGDYDEKCVGKSETKLSN